jgi:hypothetical protein
MTNEEYLKLKQHVAANEDVTSLLENKDDAGLHEHYVTKNINGYIPRRHVNSALADNPDVYALIYYVCKFDKFPAPYPQEAYSYNLYSLFATLLFLAQNKEDLKLPVDDFNTYVADVPTFLVTTKFKEYLLTGEVKISLLEKTLNKYDVSASIEDFSKIRKELA